MISIRKAKRGDEDQIMKLIRGLAEYEKAPEQVVNTAEELGNDLFELRACDAYVAEESGSIIGFALFYTNYSTWKGKCLYLEDLYILPEYRRSGAGSMLFDEVIQEAKRRKVRRMDWQILDWNEPAIEFYKKKGALLDPEWVNGRLFFE